MRVFSLKLYTIGCDSEKAVEAERYNQQICQRLAAIIATA